jgi:hypothetical protein
VERTTDSALGTLIIEHLGNGESIRVHLQNSASRDVSQQFYDRGST